MRKKKSVMFKILKIFFTMFLSLTLAAAAVFALWGYNMHRLAVEKVPPAEMAKMLRGENFVTMDELPRFYIDAVISAEDKRFYSHYGVDPKAIVRAVAHDIKAMSPEQGGSTITQQLAKNFYYDQEKRLERKFAEMFTAAAIEKELSKDEIFELYVNSIYFGDGYYGIYDAAEGYYGKLPSELNDYECAMLAGIPNAPSVYSPTENPKLAKERMKQVLDCMAECGKITEEQEENILNAKVSEAGDKR